MTKIINVSPEQIRLSNINGEYQATFLRKPQSCKGYPCGTGTTEHNAVTDLLERATRESGVKYVCHTQ